MTLKPLLLSALLALPTVALAQSEPAPEPDDNADGAPGYEPPMTLARMEEILEALDPETLSDGTRFQLTVSDVPVLIITDPAADRMRAMVPIRSTDGIDAEEMQRLMQANFDSALDARYAVARGRLWGVFIHPLSPLERDQLISGIGQTVNIALTYGTLYSGGAMQFGLGDSRGIQRQLIDELLEKGEEI